MVPLPAFKVPLFTKSPSMRMLIEGVKIPVIVTAPNWTSAPPLMVVLSLKVKELEVKIDVELAIRFPFKSTLNVLALNEPLERVRSPFIVISLDSITAAPPVFVTLRSWLGSEGTSDPVEISFASS